MAEQQGYLQLEDVLEVHPLDQIGNDVNEIIQIEPHLMITDAGRTYMRSIEVGDVSFFFARFDGIRRRTFTIGIDQITGDMNTDLVDYRWEIYYPEKSGFDDEELGKLKDITRIIGSIGLDGEA